MTKLREQMIQDMVLRGLAPSTQRAYLEAVTKFTRHYNRSPDRISNDELNAYLLYLHLEEKRATSTCNVAAALRFLFGAKDEGVPGKQGRLANNQELSLSEERSLSEKFCRRTDSLISFH
jgi:hypothetical protein